MVRSTKNKAVLPLSVSVGTIRPQTPADEVTFLEAAETTATQLADIWFEYATSVPSAPVCAITKAQPTGTSLRNWNISDQLAEMQQSGLDSSILFPFLPDPDTDHPNIFPQLELCIWILILRNIIKNWLKHKNWTHRHTLMLTQTF